MHDIALFVHSEVNCSYHHVEKKAGPNDPAIYLYILNRISLAA